jgi:hypothetical protein
MAEAVGFDQIVSNYKKLQEESGGGDLVNVPPGPYKLRVKNVVNKKAKQYLQPIYVVEDGPEAGSNLAAGVLSYKSEGAVGSTLTKLASFGIGQEQLAQIHGAGGGWDEVGKALVGRVIDVELEVQGGDGEYAKRNNLPFTFALISAPDLSGATTPAAAAPPPAATADPPPPPPPPAAPPAVAEPGDDDEPSF